MFYNNKASKDVTQLRFYVQINLVSVCMMNNFKVYCTWPKIFKNLNSRINECSELVINYFYVSFFRKRDTLAGIVLKPLLAVLELASIVMKLDTCPENAHRRKRE